jgi:serine/threonine protein kinase/WD40 repeat protein
MPRTIACPSSAELKAFLQGEFEEAEFGTISEHVEACAPCQGLLQTISPQDTLLDDARGDFSTTERLAAQIPRPLLEILKRLPERAGRGDGGAAVADDPSITEPGSVASFVPDSDASFLAPSQQSDEIGRLGSYRVLSILGRGGMGMVFLAHDPNLDRRVALKVMLPKFAANAGAKQRFLREARAAARLNSDNIVSIYQVDEDRGVPFFAMELLQGAALDQFLQGGRQLTLPQIVRIGRETAAGLAAAHEKNLIHRDIKPSNLWLDKSSAGRVKILDFGLARLEKDDINLTQDGAIVGTPAFMAPEQARGDKNVDARADLFSLGCVLYRLCAGDAPFKGETTMGVLLAIAVNNPLPLRQVNDRVPLSLSNLIMQMLSKDPTKRPASASEVCGRLQTIEREIAGAGGDAERESNLSDDADWAILATTPAPSMGSSVEDAEAVTQAIIPPLPPRWRRRLILVGAFAIAPLFVLAALLFWQTRDSVVRIESDDPAIQIAVDKDELKIVGAYDDPLTLTPGQHGLHIKKGNDFEFQTDKLVVNRGEKVVLKIEVVPGEVRLVEAGKGVLDTKSIGKPQFLYAVPWVDEQQGFSAHLWQTEISSDGRLFFADGDTGPVGAIRVCETATGKQVQSLVPGGEAWYSWAKFLPGSKFLVASYYVKKELYLYDIASGRIVRQFVGHTEPVRSFAVSPDGTRILSWSNDKTLRLWDVATGEEIRRFEGQNGNAAGVFSPDNTQILTFGDDKTLRLWSVETGKELQKLEGHTEPPTGCFSPDGKQALSYSPDATIRLWDLASGKQIRQFEGPKAPVLGASFVAGGRLVVGNSLTGRHPGAGKPYDMNFRVWNAKTGKLLREIDCTPFGEDRWTFTATPDGRQAVVNQDDGTVRVIDLITGEETHCFDNCPKARAFSFNGPLVVAGSFRAGVFVFRLASPPPDGGWNLDAK